MIAPENKSTSLDSWFTLPRFAVFLFALLFVAFPGVWLGTQSFFRSDYGVIAYPFVHYHRESFWRGEIPLWNPLSNCGAPFLAQWGTMVLYPGALIYLLLPLSWSLGVFCLLHLWLGGLGMFKLAERWTQSNFAAAAAGTVFVFNGVTLACLIWPNYTVALGWMPWVVLLVERAWKEGGRTVVLASLAASMQMFAGVPEVVVFTWLALAALALLEVQGSKFNVQCWRPLFGRFTVIIALVSALCAAQLLPFFDLLAHSQRDPTLAVGKWALPAWGWANLLVPLFHFAMSPQGFYFQQGQEFLTSCYVGTVGLALAALAVWKVRDRRVWLLGALAVFAVLMAMGNNGPLFPLVQKIIPIVGIARYPVKFLILAAFAVPLLAAFGVKWCLERTNPESRIQNLESGTAAQWQPLLVIATLLPALAALVLWWMRGHPLTYDRFAETRDNAVERMVFFGVTLALLFQACRAPRERTRWLAGLAALAFIAADGLTHLKNQNPTIPADAFLLRNAIAQSRGAPVPKAGAGRVMISPEAEQLLLHIGSTNWVQEFGFKRRMLWSNLNALENVPKVNGSSTLRIKEQDEIQQWLYGTNTVERSSFMDFLSVVGVFTLNGRFNEEWRTSALPLITGGQQPVFVDSSDRTEALKRMLSAEFDPRDKVHFDSATSRPFLVTQRSKLGAKLDKWAAHSVECEITANDHALVVIAQTFYHPWKAYVDDKPVPLLRANHAFQALEVPEGTHHVRLAYEDRNFHVGCIISLAAVLTCAALWRRGRKSGPST